MLLQHNKLGSMGYYLWDHKILNRSLKAGGGLTKVTANRSD